MKYSVALGGVLRSIATFASGIECDSIAFLNFLPQQ